MSPSPTRAVRVYLSALPEDMARERTLLLERVFPELRQRAGARGIEVELADPGAEPERWDLEARLQAIEACDIFLVFLGERYGEPLKALPYEVLPVYSWVEPSWSLLEIEIRAAALDPLPLLENQGLFFVRVPESLSGFPVVSREEAERVDSLKEKVAALQGKGRGGCRPVVHDYPAVWSAAEARATGVEDLEAVLQRGLEWALETAMVLKTAKAVSHGDYQATVEEPVVRSGRVAPEPPLPLHEDVHFTVYKPRVVAPAKWYKLLVFAHLQELPPEAPTDAPDPMEEVERQARGLLGSLADSYGEVQQGSRHAVPHEAELTFLLAIPGFDVEPPRRTLLWLEAVQSETFRIRARPAPEGGTARGRLTIFWGSILLAEMKLALKIDGRAATAPQLPAERGVARPFRKIFASYSHSDTFIVEQCERWAATLGDRYLRDVFDIRVGQRWSARLEELIREADLFQLFWSSSSLASPYVEREWRYALSLGRVDFVCPTYWEEPLPRSPERGLPPQELIDLHFRHLGVGGGTHPPLAPLGRAAAPAASPASPSLPRPAPAAPASSGQRVRPAFVAAALGSILAVVALWMPMSLTPPEPAPEPAAYQGAPSVAPAPEEAPVEPGAEEPPVEPGAKEPLGVAPAPARVVPEPSPVPARPRSESREGPSPREPAARAPLRPGSRESRPPAHSAPPAPDREVSDRWLAAARDCSLGSSEIRSAIRLGELAGMPAVEVVAAPGAEARVLVDRLNELGERARLLPVERDGAMTCSVWVGPFRSSQEAEATAGRLSEAFGVEARVSRLPEPERREEEPAAEDTPPER